MIRGKDQDLMFNKIYTCNCDGLNKEYASIKIKQYDHCKCIIEALKIYYASRNIDIKKIPNPVANVSILLYKTHNQAIHQFYIKNNVLVINLNTNKTYTSVEKMANEECGMEIRNFITKHTYAQIKN